MAETPEEVAQRLGRDPEVVATLLDQMADMPIGIECNCQTCSRLFSYA
jgi:hypothetical protein